MVYGKWRRLPDMILKKRKQGCIMKILIFLFQYKYFAIYGKQIGVPAVHETLFGGA